ncbi:cupin domain protein, partial [Vibrio parahaemolyticus VPTS-2010_2]
GS